VAAAVVGDSAVVLTIGTQGQGDVRREYRSFQTQTMVLEGERVHHRARATTAAILGASVKDLAVCYVNDPLPTVWIVRGAGLLAGCPADLLGQARN
jgi:hypothetical protein